MNRLQQLIVLLAAIVVSVYAGMKYHQYETELNCEKQGGVINENGVCVVKETVKETIKERPNKEYLQNFKTVDGKYDLIVLTALGDPINEMVVKNRPTQNVFDLQRVETNKNGIKFQDKDGYFLRLTDRKFYWGHQNVVLASGRR